MGLCSSSGASGYLWMDTPSSSVSTYRRWTGVLFGLITSVQRRASQLPAPSYWYHVMAKTTSSSRSPQVNISGKLFSHTGCSKQSLGCIRNVRCCVISNVVKLVGKGKPSLNKCHSIFFASQCLSYKQKSCISASQAINHTYKPDNWRKTHWNEYSITQSHLHQRHLKSVYQTISSQTKWHPHKRSQKDHLV